MTLLGAGSPHRGPVWTSRGAVQVYALVIRSVVVVAAAICYPLRQKQLRGQTLQPCSRLIPITAQRCAQGSLLVYVALFRDHGGVSSPEKQAAIELVRAPPERPPRRSVRVCVALPYSGHASQRALIWHSQEPPCPRFGALAAASGTHELAHWSGSVHTCGA